MKDQRPSTSIKPTQPKPQTEEATSKNPLDPQQDETNPNEANANFLSPVSNNTFQDFIKICKSYYKELKTVNLNNHKLSSDDLIVLNSLISETNEYATALARSKFLDESFELISLNEKIVNLFLVIFKNLLIDSNSSLSASKLISFPYSLKLYVLETKFLIYFSICSKVDEAEKILNESIQIIKNFDLNRHFLGNTLFYLASVKVLQGSVDEGEKLGEEALELIETSEPSPNESSELVSVEFPEYKKIRKLGSILEFLAEVYDLKKK